TTSVCRPRANNDDNNSSNNIKTANTRESTSTTQTATARRRPTNSIESLQLLQLPSLLLLTILMSQLHQFTGGGLAMAAPTSAPAAAQVIASFIPSARPSPETTSRSDLLELLTSTAMSPVRMRLQKRHDTYSFKQRFHLELNSSALDWSNGCGGNWTGPDGASHILRPHKRCAKHKKLLRTLQNKTGRELRQLRDDNNYRHPVSSLSAPDTSSNQAIDISQHAQWKVQSSQYKFLPRLNNNSDHLPLRRVHHDLQFYVASFSYLRHAQLHYDYEYLQTQSVLSSELNRLRSSARNILCFVEEAINATNRLYPTSPAQRAQQIGQTPLSLGRIKTVPRVPMEKRLLKFKTPLVELHKQAVLAARNQPAAKPQEPHILDALFLKYQYIQYLKNVTQMLGKQRKRKCERKIKSKTNTNTKLATPPAKLRQRQKK
ncbi:hypothetical protein KR044_005586, partial [Drosophila immigrans]